MSPDGKLVCTSIMHANRCGGFQSSDKRCCMVSCSNPKGDSLLCRGLLHVGADGAHPQEARQVAEGQLATTRACRAHTRKCRRCCM
jgi:hypothetical protein